MLSSCPGQKKLSLWQEADGQEDDSLAELRQETAVLPPVSQQSLEGQSGKLLSVSRNCPEWIPEGLRNQGNARGQSSTGVHCYCGRPSWKPGCGAGLVSHTVTLTP